MKKKATRILAMLLVFVMLVSASCVTAFAKLADISTPYQDENGKYYFTYEQSGTYIMNLIDELLSTVNQGKDMYFDLKIASYTLTLQSYDKALQSIYDFRKSGLINAAVTLGVAGSLRDLNVDRLNGYTKRGDTNKWDYECLYNLVGFLYDNRGVLRDIANGSFGWGLIDDFVDLPELILDLDGYLANLAYTKVEELAGKEEGAEGSGTTATTYDPKGKDVDRAVNDILLWLFNTKIPELVNFDGTLGLSMNDINVTSTSLYDMVHNVIEAALSNLAVPLLKDVLLDAFGIETSEAFPNGTEDQMDNSTLNLVVGLIEGLLIDPDDETASKPDYTGVTTPGAKIEALLTWFFADGGMSKYIVIDNNGLALTDDFVDLLYKVARIGIPMLSGMDFGTLPKEMLHADELNEVDPVTGEPLISDSQCIAILLNMLFSNILQGYYCNPNAKTVSEIGAYCLASLCARILPQYNYMEQLEANWEPNHQITGIDGNTISALPFTSTYTVNGQVANGSGGWTATSRSYTIPYAAVDMGVTIGVYFLDGLITADFSQVPGPGTDATVRFEKFVKVLIDWAVNKYLPLFKTAYNLDSAYPSYQYVWKEIDEVLFGLIPTSWLPASITDHTMGSEFTTQGQGGNATMQLKMSGDLICGWLLGSVMDVDLQQLVSLFQRNNTSGAELNNPTLTVLLRLIDRILYVALGKYAILPSNEGSRNAYSTPTTITSLGQGNNGLLKDTNFGNLVYYLVQALGGGSSFNINAKAVPILRTALPLIMGADYIKPYRKNVLNVGQISVSDLRALIEKINGQGGVKIPYGVASVDETTEGTYYYLDQNYNLQTATLPEDYVDGRTYYSEQYVVAQNIDKFTNSATYNNGTGVYSQSYVYTPVTLDGSNFVNGAIYCSPEFVTATVTETTNGTYFTSQDENSAVTLPDAYNAQTTYYTHPEVVLGASDEGSYLLRTYAYTPVTLNGQGGGFNENKVYYKKAISNADFNYMDAYNPSTHRIAMGVYKASGTGVVNGVGIYQSSISNQDFMVFRNQEDFPDALYTFNNFNDFIEDADAFIGEYNSFLQEIKDAADEWKADDPNGDGIKTIYPYYSSSGNYDRRTTQYGVTPAEFNQLQVIKDFIALYGAGSFVTGKPLEFLSSDKDASTTKRQCEIYKQWNKYAKQVIKMSNRLNEYYDGINYYLQTAEAARKSYSDTVVYSLKWVMYKLCATAYNGGENGYIDELTGNRVPTYTDKSWAKFKAAYECAIDALAQVQLNQASAKTTQSMITAVRSGLIEAYYGLTKAGDLADMVQLYNAIVLARRTLADPSLDATYTAASISTLRTVLGHAVDLFESVVEADEQDRVDTQTARLNTAISNLVYLVAPSLDVDDSYDGDLDIPQDQTYSINNIKYGFIYGISEGDGLVLDLSMFNVNGINSEFVKVISQTYGNGTGSYIQAKDSNDSVKFIYFAVLFGDVNGDARIDGTDKLYIQAKARGAANTALLDEDNNGGAYKMAADVDGDGSITESDAAEINKVINYEATINQDSTFVGSRVIPV